MVCVWRVCGGCVEGVWRVCGGCVEGVWRVCGGGVEGVWRVCGVCVQGVRRGCGGCAARHLRYELEKGAEVDVVDDLGLELGAVEGGQRAERTVGRHVLRESGAEWRGGAGGCRGGAEAVQGVQKRCTGGADSQGGRGAGGTGQGGGGVRGRRPVPRCGARCAALRACGEAISLKELPSSGLVSSILRAASLYFLASRCARPAETRSCAISTGSEPLESVLSAFVM